METDFIWDRGKEIPVDANFQSSSKEQVLTTALDLKSKTERAMKRPVNEILDVLDRVSETLTFNPEKLAVMAGISTREAAEESEVVKQFLKKDNLLAYLQPEFNNLDALDGFVKRGTVNVMYRATGLMLHNLAGNAIIVAPGSIAIALITKNVNLLKLPSNDFYTGPMIAKEIAKHHSEIGEEISTLYWKGSDNDIYDALFGISGNDAQPIIDGCIAWGGHESINPMRVKSAVSGVHFVEHGPKMSFAVYFTKGIIKNHLSKSLEKTAGDIVKRRGRACKSPRFIAVEKCDELSLEQFARMLLNEILKVNEIYPPTNETFNIAAGIKESFRNSGFKTLIPPTLTNEAVVGYAESFANITPGILNQCGDRAIITVSFTETNEISQFLQKYRLQPLMQTMSIFPNGDHQLEFIKKMSFCGISNVVNPGEMDFIHPGDVHDGFPNFSTLMKMTTNHLL
jgi:hypothetical protein